MFVHLWKGRNNHVGMIESPLFVPMQESMNFEDSRASNFTWEFNVDVKTVMEYISQILAWSRVCMLEDMGDGFSGVDYWTKHVLAFDVLQENWGGEMILGFPGFGQRMADLLTVPLDSDPESEEYKEASKIVWRLLTKSSMQKITHGKGLTKDVQLGTIWDQPENKGKDRAPGTFAELLRFGCVNFVQSRESVVYVNAPRPPKTLQKGLLEE